MIEDPFWLLFCGALATTTLTLYCASRVGQNKDIKAAFRDIRPNNHADKKGMPATYNMYLKRTDAVSEINKRSFASRNIASSYDEILTRSGGSAEISRDNLYFTYANKAEASLRAKTSRQPILH